MIQINHYQQLLTTALDAWSQHDYATAMTAVDSLRQHYPHNAHVQTLWGNLVQLQEDTLYSLADAKQALETAVVLDQESPQPLLELGYYLQQVEDNPQRALEVFVQSVQLSRQAFLAGLMAQAKLYQELGQDDELHQCCAELALFAASGHADVQLFLDELSAQSVSQSFGLNLAKELQ
jgi:tetratricopeptide (TPR) repeat protein